MTLPSFKIFHFLIHNITSNLFEVKPCSKKDKRKTIRFFGNEPYKALVTSLETKALLSPARNNVGQYSSRMIPFDSKD
jgi:hypothetical protein